MSDIKYQLSTIKYQIILLLAICFTSCDPNAQWDVKGVDIDINAKYVSAGFVECDFATNKEAYYLIDIIPVSFDPDPMEHQKQFMTLRLDEQNMEYLRWRNELLNYGQFTIAPFASYALQYGEVEYIFTGLDPATEYWIYAFVVNPDKMTPVGKLHLQKVRTKAESTMDIHFSYRVKGIWDYAYPLDSSGKLQSRFPYLATTLDSAELALLGVEDPIEYCLDWISYYFIHPEQATVLYGVKAVENDGWSSSVEFQPGHTYYTLFTGFDGAPNNITIYKFTWAGEEYEHVFKDTDPENVYSSYESWLE